MEWEQYGESLQWAQIGYDSWDELMKQERQYGVDTDALEIVNDAREHYQSLEYDPRPGTTDGRKERYGELCACSVKKTTSRKTTPKQNGEKLAKLTHRHPTH